MISYLTFVPIRELLVMYVRRPADVLGVCAGTSGANGFIGGHRTSYTPEWVYSRLHRHHSLQQRSLHLRPIQTVCNLDRFSNRSHQVVHSLITLFIVRPPKASRSRIISNFDSIFGQQITFVDAPACKNNNPIWRTTATLKIYWIVTTPPALPDKIVEI